MKTTKNKQILIAGATGLIGRELTQVLVELGYNVMILTRNPKLVRKEFSGSVGYIEWKGFFTNWLVREVEKSFAVINLAGESIGDKRWTRSRRMKLVRSRLGTTRALAKACQYAIKKPEVFVQGSAIGFYPFSDTDIFTEANNQGSGFLSQLTVDWEAVALHEVPKEIRLVIIRTGVVLSQQGGILPKLVKPINFFIGGWFGKGNQIVSWIHIHDEVNAIVHLLENGEAKGFFNLTAPNPITQIELVKAIAQKLNRPAWIAIPPFFVKRLFGLMGVELLLKGSQVNPKRLIDSGFVFKYHSIGLALENLFGK